MKQAKSYRWGMSTPAAEALAGDIHTIAAAGSDLDGATRITGEIVNATSGSGGIKLPTDCKARDMFVVNNDIGGTLSLYPPTSAGTINGGSAGAAITISDNDSCIVVAITNDDFITVPRTPS